MVRAAIENRIEQFAAAADPRLEGVRTAVRRQAFLPLYVGWMAVLGVLPDGSFVRWDHDSGEDALKPLLDPFWQRMAALQGARQYPELLGLVPQRPASAQTCDKCEGSGQLKGLLPHLVCECGGLGWSIPSERRDPAPV
jgi:hypothetical protein